MAANKTGRILAKGLGIDLDYRKEHQEPLSSGAVSISSVETCKIFQPRCMDSADIRKTSNGIQRRKNGFRTSVPLLAERSAICAACFRSGTGFSITILLGSQVISLQVSRELLQPSFHRLTGLGVTVGFVVIPQGMAYALLAKLPPEYGLYTSFMGFLLYWAFATSKDITIGVRTI